MKIDESIHKSVCQSMDECQKTLECAIVTLLKTIGVRPGEDCCLGTNLFLYQYEGNHTTTILVDEISFTGGSPAYNQSVVNLWFDDEFVCSTQKISLSNLFIVYEALRSVALQH